MANILACGRVLTGQANICRLILQGRKSVLGGVTDRGHFGDGQLLKKVGLGGGGHAVRLQHRLALVQKVGAGVAFGIQRRVAEVCVLTPQQPPVSEHQRQRDS